MNLIISVTLSACHKMRLPLNVVAFIYLSMLCVCVWHNEKKKKKLPRVVIEFIFATVTWLANCHDRQLKFTNNLISIFSSRALQIEDALKVTVNFA